MTIPSCLTLRDASAKIPCPNGISKLDREFPSWSLRKSEESRARIAVDQEIEATSSLKDFIVPNQLGEKISVDHGFCYPVNRSFTLCHPLTL